MGEDELASNMQCMSDMRALRDAMQARFGADYQVYMAKIRVQIREQMALDRIPVMEAVHLICCLAQSAGVDILEEDSQGLNIRELVGEQLALQRQGRPTTPLQQVIRERLTRPPRDELPAWWRTWGAS